MSSRLRYGNHVEHYRIDGEEYDFFSPDPLLAVQIDRRYEAFFHIHRPERGARVLEVGSGGGVAAGLLGPLGARYFPVDIPKKNLARIRDDAPGPVFPTSADAYRLPFRGGGFDLVILSEIVEHLEEPAVALREAARVLRPGGTLLLSVPYREEITYQICIHCNKPTPTHSHLHSFDEGALARLVAGAGLAPPRLSLHLNKIPSRLRLAYLLRGVPFRYWRLVDSLCNRIVRKASTIIAVAEKPPDPGDRTGRRTER